MSSDDSWAKMTEKVNGAAEAYKRAIISEMITAGWTPPAGWTDEDTSKLGRTGTYDSPRPADQDRRNAGTAGLA